MAYFRIYYSWSARNYANVIVLFYTNMTVGAFIFAVILSFLAKTCKILNNYIYIYIYIYFIECYYIHLHLLLHTLPYLQFHTFTLLTHKYYITHSFTYTCTDATITRKKLNTSLHLVTGKKK